MRADYINPNVYLKIYHIMQYENALALRLSLETGMRISDCLSLTADSLDGQKITFIAQKTGKRGVKKISADLTKRLRGISGKKYIFEGRFGTKPRTRQAVWKDVKKAGRELKINANLTCHSARKTFAVEDFHDNGFNHTQKELQHDRAETTMLYAYSDLLTADGRQHGGNDEILRRLIRIENKLDMLLNSCSLEQSAPQ